MSYIGNNVQPVNNYGASGGDFDGVSILDSVVRGDLALSTQVINQPTRDINGNLILSDAPFTGRFTGIVAQAIIIDTLGYQTLQITTNSTFAATGGVQFSNDGITFAQSPMMTAPGVWATAFVASTNYTIPVVARFARITPTTAGSITYFLRNIPSQLTGQNLTAIGGTAVSASTGQLGVNLITSIATTNGQTLGTLVAPLTVAATVVKATAGRLYSISVGNAQASIVYLKLYNAASVTLGTTSPIQNIMIPASSSVELPINDYGLYFSTGICIAVTGGQALLDSTALTTAAVVNYSFI